MLSDPSITSKVVSRVELSLIFKYFFTLPSVFSDSLGHACKRHRTGHIIFLRKQKKQKDTLQVEKATLFKYMKCCQLNILLMGEENLCSVSLC